MADLAVQPAMSCAAAAHSAMVGMVISGRASRACDVCGKERARWYCAADMAYLCQHCDGAVHSANAVAGRHERARLGPDGNPARPAQASSAWAAEMKQEAAEAAHLLPPHFSSPHFNPRKRPRSIRRHKPSSFRASKHVFSAFNSRNHDHLQSTTSDINNYVGSILASTHGVMIDNPRSNPDFIAIISGDELLNKSLPVKAEPCSPIAVGDLIKVPDYIDADDQLLESLFDFRDLQDDGHFLHQVPVYNPLQFSQGLSPARSPAEEHEYDDKSSIISLSSIPSVSLLPESNQCSNNLSRELFKTEESEGASSAESADMHDGAQPHRNSSMEDGIIEPNGDVCDLVQLDFDCVLERNEENSDEISHAPSDMGVAIKSHDYLDPCSDHEVGVDDSGCTGVSYDSCIDYTMDDVDAQYDCECSGAEVGIDFNLCGHENPPNWQCNMKVESPSELGVENMSQGCLDDEHDEALLREKLINCKASAVDSSRLNFRLGLELNFEDVLVSWSDRGSFWIDGHAPSDVTNCLDFLGGFFVPHMNGTSAAERSQQQLIANLKIKRDDGGAREASVLRYREKRHTRLFSKKIRYEVRKLNAEKRPRMKGRFVKRIVAI